MPRDGYIGRAPGDSSVIIAKQTFEPTGVQTNFTFTSGYTVGYLDVYINGARQINASDYTASDGSTVGLTTYATSGDVLELVAYKAFNVSNPISNTSGGDLLVGGDLTVTGTSNVGVVTGGTYYGDGSNLSGVGVPGVSTTGHSVFNTINASGIVTASSFSGDGSNLSGISTAAVPGINTERHSVFNTIKASGITTISATTSSTSTTTGALIVSGGVGIAKSLFVGEGVSVAGTITYADVTNVDSIGIVTAGNGLYVGRTSIGVTATTAGHIIAAGIITATSFAGDGSSLTGIESWNQQDTWLFSGG